VVPGGNGALRGRLRREGYATRRDRSPRSWVEQGYPNVTYYRQADTGGHFAAWEEPQLFSEEIRPTFRCFAEGRTR